MNKQELLEALRAKLNGLPKEDIDEACDYYSEIIDDRMEEGLNEAEAVSALGPIDQIAAQIIAGASLPKLVRAKAAPSRPLSPREIILIISASPIWLPLLLAGIGLFLSIYIILWAALITLYAVAISFAAGSAAGIAGGAALIISGQTAHGVLYLGLGLICVGLTILLTLCSFKCTALCVSLSKKILLKTKLYFIKRGEAK